MSAIPFVQAHPGNYRPGRTLQLEYIVLHFTANDGDTDANNAAYFARVDIATSAHYFCDEDSVTQSVLDKDTAYHCGGSPRLHDSCINANSIGIEMCSDIRSGHYVITPETVSRAIEITAVLAETYDIPASNILRHYDVTGKRCPEPWVRVPSEWTAFKAAVEAAREALRGGGAVSVEEAKRVLRDNLGLAEETIQYLWSYRWGDQLLIRLAEAVK